MSDPTAMELFCDPIAHKQSDASSFTQGCTSPRAPGLHRCGEQGCLRLRVLRWRRVGLTSAEPLCVLRARASGFPGSRDGSRLRSLQTWPQATEALR